MLDHRVLELCNDREFVLVAVTENGIALKDACAALHNDASFMQAAMLYIHWNGARLLFLGHADPGCLLSLLPIELLRRPCLLALLWALSRVA